MTNDELQMTNGTLLECRAWRCALSPIRHSKFSIRHSPAWVQHFIHHLAPQTAQRESAFLQREALPQVVSAAKDNMAGFLLANSSISSNRSGEGEIPKSKRRLWTNQKRYRTLN